MNTQQAVTDLSDVIAYHLEFPFQGLKLSADELESVVTLVRFALERE